MPSISRLELWDAYFEVKQQKDWEDFMLNVVKDKLKVKDSLPDWDSKVKEVLRAFIKTCNKYYKSHSISYHNSIFKERHKLWLSAEENFPDIKKTGSTRACTGASTSRMGRPQVENFQDLKEDSKRRRTKSLRDSRQTEELVHATGQKLKSTGKVHAAKVLKKVTDASPRTVNMIFLAVEKIKRTDSGNLVDGSPIAFTEAEAVTHQIECDFSKEKYIYNRDRLIMKNCKVFPSYERISKYKMECIPDNINVTEKKACVSLQNLLDHTVARIISVQEDVFKDGNVEGTSLELVTKIGFDASGSHSNYNQIWKETEADDSTMVLSALVPPTLTPSEI